MATQVLTLGAGDAVLSLMEDENLSEEEKIDLYDECTVFMRAFRIGCAPSTSLPFKAHSPSANHFDAMRAIRIIVPQLSADKNPKFLEHAIHILVSLAATGPFF